MKTAPILAILALAGCASAPGTGRAPEAPTRIMTTGTTADVRIANDTDTGLLPVRATPEVAWVALPGVFEALQIPVEHIDPARKVLGNGALTARRTLGGQPLSAFLSCGSTMSGPIATQYDVRLSVVSQIVPAAEGEAGVRTRVEATARSRTGASGSPVPCASTGGLEKRIADLLNRSIGG